MSSPARSRSRSASSASKKSRNRSKSSSLSRSRSRSRSSERDEYRLHIADIGDDIRRGDLEKVFSPFGNLKEVWMTNSTPCFGFAVFKDKKSASAALKAADGTEVAGCRIRVSYARPRTRGSGRRYYTSSMRCYQCGYTGHFYRDCPEITGGSDKRDRDRYDRTRRSGGGGGGGGYREREWDYGGGGGGRGGDRRQSSYRSSRRYEDYGGGGRRHYRSSRRERY